MYKIAGYIAGIEIAGLLGFIVVARYQEGVYRHFPLLIAFVAVGYVAYSMAKGVSYKEIAYVAIVASAIFVSAVQFLGFTFFPGLAKDIGFLSEENAIRTAAMLLIGTVGHILLLTAVRIGRTWSA
jgi:cytochrome bd-type quinol oxidase subunit 2